MQTLRTSATDIDAFRRYRDSEDGDLEALLNQFWRRTEPTEQMKAGSALHKALEDTPDGEFTELAADGYTFHFSADAEVDIPTIRECKATRDYQIGDCIVTLVGKVDAVHGRRIDDHKFTSWFDSERFLNSYQWRIYLEVFGADEFRWNVFEGKESDPKHYIIKDVHPLTMHRYPSMGDDVERQLAEFVEFARRFLPERMKVAA